LISVFWVIVRRFASPLPFAKVRNCGKVMLSQLYQGIWWWWSSCVDMDKCCRTCFNNMFPKTCQERRLGCATSSAISKRFVPTQNFKFILSNDP
jgi:hypothetical protein